MRKLIATALMSIAAAAALPAGSLAARNPSGTGKPSQSCQEIEANGGSTSTLSHRSSPASYRRFRRLFQRDRLAGATSAIRRSPDSRAP